MLAKVALSLGLLVAGAQAQQAANCIYQQLVCGSTLLVAPYIYTDAQLTAAANDTVSVPPLTTAQLSQTLFHCTDTVGTITANAYCFAGCDVKPGTRNSQCIM